jgi:glycerol-3-phosphate O-acyltransferase
MVQHAETLGMIVRESLPFGDVLGHDPNRAILMTWYRNNALHAFALPSLIACLLVNRPRRIARDQLMTMIAAVYPYLQSELYLGAAVDLELDVTRWIGHLTTQSLLVRVGDEVGPPPPESDEYYRLTLLAQIVMQMLERYFIVVGLLQHAGQRRIDRATLEADCITLARRMSRLYGLNAPEFFDARLFHTFVDTLIARGAVTVGDDGLLSYGRMIGEVTRASSDVLPIEFRLAVLRAQPHDSAPTAQLRAGARPR